MTNHSIADIISRLLISLGHAVLPVDSTSDWAVYVNDLPDLDDVRDKCLSVSDVAGILDGRIHRTGEIIEHPGWQIRLRAGSFPVGYAKMAAIARSLDAVRGVEIAVSPNRYKIYNVQRVGSIIPIGVETNDRKRRPLFTLNGIATITQL